MSTIVIWCRKFLTTALIAAFGLGVVPLSNVHALAAADPGNPPNADQTVDRLARAWAREQAIYNRLGTFLGNADGRLANAQDLIHKAGANGRDISEIQAALDAFSEAIRQVQPIYDSAGTIVTAHQGFDENGKVVDQTQALQTVKDLGGDLRGIRQPLVGSGKAFREALRAFRKANRPASTASPDQNSG